MKECLSIFCRKAFYGLGRSRLQTNSFSRGFLFRAIWDAVSCILIILSLCCRRRRASNQAWVLCRMDRFFLKIWASHIMRRNLMKQSSQFNGKQEETRLWVLRFINIFFMASASEWRSVKFARKLCLLRDAVAAVTSPSNDFHIKQDLCHQIKHIFIVGWPRRPSLWRTFSNQTF